MTHLAIGSFLALLVSGALPLQEPAQEGQEPAADATEAKFDKWNYDKSRFHCKFCELDATENDPLSIPVTNGIVWYGTWEDAMAEKERTGKPVVLHFGSPRCQSVPGVW